MSFLDNTGDIILDAVLTHIGRKKLAEGRGSFRVTHFTLGDDEINYALYDTSVATARRDLEILQTPILEARTDSTAGSKYRLLTLEDRDILFLPVARLNTKTGGGQFTGFPYASSAENGSDTNQFVVVANRATAEAYIGPNAEKPTQFPDGFINGTSGRTAKDNRIIIDQGLDTTSMSYLNPLPSQLKETAYLISIDNRVLVPVDIDGTDLPVSYTDTNHISTYLAAGRQAGLGSTPGGGNATQGDAAIDGPRGPRFHLGIRPAIDVVTPTKLYTQIGNSTTGYGTRSLSVDYITTTVRVTGLDLGITTDFQVKVIRKNN